MKAGPLAIILFAGALLRFGYFFLILNFNPEGFWITDSGEYWRLAENLINHLQFSKSNGAPFEPEHLRTPLYPLYISLINLTGGGLYAVIISQIIISLATIWVVWKTTWLISFNKISSGIAASFFALDLPSMIFSNYVLSETLYVFLLASAVYLFVLHYRYKKIHFLISFGFVAGLTALCRPSSIYLLALWPILLLFSNENFRIKLSRASLFTLIFALTILPWLVRNKTTFDKFFFSTTSDFMMAAWVAPNIKAIRENKGVAEARYELWTDWYYNSPYDAYHEPLDYMHYVRDKSMSIISSEPGIALKQHALGVFHLLAKPARGQFAHQLTGVNTYDPATTLNEASPGSDLMKTYNKSAGWLVLLVVFQLLMLFLLYSGILGLALTLKRNKETFLILFLGVTVLLLVNLVVPPITYSRFRMPALPLLVILSGIGWANLLNYVITRRLYKV